MCLPVRHQAHLLNNELRTQVKTPQANPAQYRTAHKSARRKDWPILVGDEKYHNARNEHRHLPATKPQARTHRPDLTHRPRRNPRRKHLKRNAHRPRQPDLRRRISRSEEIRDHLPREVENGEVEERACDRWEERAVVEVRDEVGGGFMRDLLDVIPVVRDCPIAFSFDA